MPASPSPYIPCKHCGYFLDSFNRSHRNLWQRILYPASRQYRCPHCGKRTLVVHTPTV